MTRYKAAGIHLLASAGLLLLIFLLVRFIWYPGALFSAAAGASIFKIILAVDLVLGPLLMLIIFNPQKASLKFDIAVVIALQLGFMAYGVWSVHTVRPVYLAFVQDKFYMVAANDIDDADRQKATNSAYRQLPQFGPQLVGTTTPTDAKAREEAELARLGGMGLQNLPQYFVPYQQVAAAVKNAGKEIKNLKHLTLEEQQRYQAFEREYGKPVLLLPFIGKRQNLAAIVDATSGAWLAAL